jgi:adenylate cyclase
MDAAAIPALDATGNLPLGIYRATLDAIQARFCTGEVRAHWGQVLREVVALVQSTERVEAMYIFGSFVTAKAAPADLDLFVIMAADFTSERVEGRARLLFDRSRAALVWGICLYWMTAQTDRTPFLAAWQLRRDGGLRGIVEIQW